RCRWLWQCNGLQRTSVHRNLLKRLPSPDGTTAALGSARRFRTMALSQVSALMESASDRQTRRGERVYENDADGHWHETGQKVGGLDVVPVAMKAHYAYEAVEHPTHGHEVDADGNVTKRNTTQRPGDGEKDKFAIKPDKDGRAVDAEGKPLETDGARGFGADAPEDHKIFVTTPDNQTYAADAWDETGKRATDK